MLRNVMFVLIKLNQTFQLLNFHDKKNKQKKKHMYDLIILNLCQQMTVTAGSFLVMKVHIKISTHQHQRYVRILSIS